MKKKNSAKRSNDCNIDDPACPEHSGKKANQSSKLNAVAAARDKLTVKEYRSRIEQKIAQDPEVARKAAKIIELWLSKEKYKFRKAG